MNEESMMANRRTMADCELQIDNRKLQVANCRLTIADCRLSIDHRLSISDSSFINYRFPFIDVRVANVRVAHGC